MDREIVILITALAGSFLAGIVLARFLFRKASLIKNSDNTFTLRVPCIGKTSLPSLPKYQGIVIEELLELNRNIERLKRFLDLDFVLKYSSEFKINYIGTEGDMEDGSWSPGRLAYCAMSSSYKGGYNIYLNPNLDMQAVSTTLSWELQTPISPSEVYPFLFLHEVGHTTHAGNQNFYTAVVNHALSGGRRSAKRRKELSTLKNSIERFADRFALRELSRWREGRGAVSPG
ncbi:MAG: hypothetical protein K8I29_15055 [Alphaproteobacteria bacterium]|uniref:Uncharacterized protein n=1 Tax=Candidatus Nitrobium versatile TaxID=2884831 RepID=A0A953M1Z4_9BACT|nr:hypothetical protein [Candidatus Nitrobium versatile]